MFSGRRGVEGYVVLLILFLVVLGVFLFFQGAIFRSADDSFSRDECAASVRANAFLGLESSVFSRSVRCPARRVEIPSSDIAVPVIAGELAECWRVFGQGRLNLFSGDGVFCVPCSVVFFDKPGVQISGLGEYLASKPVPVRFGQGTYLEYLTGYATPGIGDYYAVLVERGKQIVSPSLDSSKNYGVVFVTARGLDALSRLKSWAGSGYAVAGSGLAVGSVVGYGAALLFGGPVGIAVGGLTAVGSGIYVFIAGDEPVWLSFVTIVPWEQGAVSELGCEYLPSESILNPS